MLVSQEWAAIERSQASLAQLSKELGINPETVCNWRKRATVEGLKTGPKEPHSTVLTETEEAPPSSLATRTQHIRGRCAST
nr:helix-turn-helix domain-containing protein [Roseicitreum antarcticum]